MAAKRKILVVEDNALNRGLLCEILKQEYDPVEAENGQEALDILRARKEAIALIMLDIVMPVMDGYAFLDIVKSDPAYASIPVIVTTQKDGESDEVAALSHGAADFVAKPYRPQIILHRVAGIIHLRETAALINEFQYDRLTGLYSKGFFYQQAKEILRQHPEQSYDIICSDIVNFKLVNDIFGVPTGDRLLCSIASLSTEFTGGNGICGHLNADQFACLIAQKDPYTNEMFQAICAKANDISMVKNIVIKWGIYHVEDRELPVEQMCDRALLAARSIKEQYGKYFALYDDALRSKLLLEQAIVDSMESALADGQFEVYLQPQYRLIDNALTGAEALVRWNHPQWGLQAPAQFIPLFEKSGFITKLDAYVWDKACAVLHKWDQHGFPALSLSVNVSRADIYNADLPDILQKIVQKHHLAPARLHLEITESAYTENLSQMIDTVTRLRNVGFVIEMDDFGSGYSSLNMLQEMPVDVLKLDMKFLQSETKKPANQGILRFIISLARWMSLRVTAEGVETKEQLNRLRGIGCDCAQGYYFAKPMPVKEFESLARNHFVPPGAQSAARLQAPAQKLLLVADEDAAYCRDVKKAFAQDYTVVEAPDGNAVIDCIAAYPDKLAAVILSFTLPHLDRFSFLLMMQQRGFSHFPIIVTAAPNAALEAKALELGADDFICKPHLPQSLAIRLQRAIDRAAGGPGVPKA